MLKKSFRISLVWTVEKLFRYMPKTARELVGNFNAFLAFRLLKARRSTVESNLRIAFPEWSDQEIRETARRCYYFHARSLVNFLNVQENLDCSSLTVQGEENFETLQKKGGIILSGHLGSWESGLCEIADEIPDVWLFADEQSNPYADNVIREARGCRGVRTVTGLMNLRKLIRHLKNGGTVAIASDRRSRNSEYTATFFNRKIECSPILPRLLKHTTCPVVLFSMLRDGSNYQMNFSEMLRPEVRGETQKPEIDELVQEYFHWLEDEIRKSPHQYFWFHKRWKNTS